jgi:CDP-6-deoxy-D-xylo-4-hexulose-3-dehydrase
MPITVRNHIDRNKLIAFLEERKIATRLVFAGNILKQPGFRHIEHRVHKDLRGTDQIMENTFFIGVYPGLTREMMQYVVESFNDFFSQI